MALSPGDLKKVLRYKSAKEIWNALKRLYQGNEDVKKNRILAASRDYENALQEKNESLEDFHSRFQGYIGQMEFLGEVIPEWKITHQFLQALNQKWDAVTLALQAQSDIKEITLEELVARLQSNAGVLERKAARREPEKMKSIALKVERAFDLAQTDGYDEEEDETTALITRAIRMASIKSKYSSEGRKQTEGSKGCVPEENKERLCYHCQRKGHMAKDCYKRKAGEPPAQKSRRAMLASWGESDEDTEDSNPGKDACMMASLKGESSQVTTKVSKSKITELLELLEKLTTENQELKLLLDKQEEMIADSIEENNLWANKAMKLEREKEALDSKENHQSCQACKDIERQIRSLEETITQMESDHNELTHTLESVRVDDEEKKKKWMEEQKTTNSEKIKTDFATRFVSRPGIGYNDTSKEAVSSAKVDSSPGIELSHRKQCKCPCRKNCDKRDESLSGTNPFNGSKAYSMWLKQSQNKAPSKVDFKSRICNKPIWAGQSKYVNLKEHMICWHCGRAGHLRWECKKLKRAYKKAQIISRAKPLHQPRSTTKRRIDSYIVNPRTVNCDSTVIPKPSKPKLVWVRKN